MLESLWKMRVEKSEEFKNLLQVCGQELTFGDKRYYFCRSKLMVQRHLEQTIKIEKPRQQQTCKRRAPSKKKAKAKGKENDKNKSVRGDRIRWIPKDQCSFGDSYAFKHEPNKRGQGKGRPCSPLPTGLPHRNSGGDGQVLMTEERKAHQYLL